MHMHLLYSSNSVYTDKNGTSFIKKHKQYCNVLFSSHSFLLRDFNKNNIKHLEILLRKKNSVSLLCFFQAPECSTSYVFSSISFLVILKNTPNNWQYLVLLWLLLMMKVTISCFLLSDQREEGNLYNRKEHFGVSQREVL